MEKTNDTKKLSKLQEKSLDMDSYWSGQIKMKFIKKVMEDEGWTYEETMKACNGNEDEIVPKYSVGYKLCDPAMLMICATKKGKQQFRDRWLMYDSEKKIWDEEFSKQRFGGFKEAVKQKFKSR